MAANTWLGCLIRAHARITNVYLLKDLGKAAQQQTSLEVGRFQGQNQPTTCRCKTVLLENSTCTFICLHIVHDCFQPTTDLSNGNRNGMPHKAENIYDLDLSLKKMLTSSSVGIHYQSVGVGFEDEIDQQSSNWVIWKVSLRSKLLIFF